MPAVNIITITATIIIITIIIINNNNNNRGHFWLKMAPRPRGGMPPTQPSPHHWKRPWPRAAGAGRGHAAAAVQLAGDKAQGLSGAWRGRWDGPGASTATDCLLTYSKGWCGS